MVREVYSLPLNPVSMSDTNKAKEYGYGIAGLVCSIASFLASMLCMYWFCRMGKRFRHKLIMILVYGDLVRGIWIFVFAVLTLAHGTVSTTGAFCQISGFLVQYGTETSDYAVLVMALHSAIQVFYPSTLVSSDGLYPVRRYVYTLAFVLPALMAALAFVNPRNAYVSQGGYCTLPIRPFWYRLALTWIPRYIIILTIVGVAIAIYVHVGFKFRGYSKTDSNVLSFKTSDDSTMIFNDTQEEPKMEDITFELNSVPSRPQPQRRKSSVGHDLLSTRRRASAPEATSPSSSSHVPQRVSFESGKTFRPLPGSTVNLTRPRPEINRPALLSIPSGRSFDDPISPLGGPRIIPEETGSDDKDKDSSTAPQSSRPSTPPNQNQVTQAKRRQRIHRQLRLMFIYPLVYSLMWLIPFAMHCMNYWDKYAMNPVEFLRVGASICISLMGFVDALIFSVREKPWRGIDNSDGTFWGSFVIRRRALGDVEVDAQGHQVRSSFSGSGRGRNWGSQGHRASASASGDGARAAADQARQRLDMEREERMDQLGDRPRKSWESWDHDDEGGGEEHEEQHEGLDVGDGKEGQLYDDNGLEDDTADTEYNRNKF